MRPLILFEAGLAELARVREYAEENPIHLARLLRQVDRYNGRGNEPFTGDDPGHVAFIPVGFRVVFSIEEMPLKDGTGTNWFKHLSVSVDGGKYPNEHSVLMIMEALNMPPRQNCMASAEPGSPPYVEVIGPVPPDEAERYKKLTAGKS